MAVDLNDEILQDFLIEAGEIQEQLNEQLVDLEQTPEDADLLNSIFRGFHTIKGGGSFLSLTSLVEVCHKSEDVFNLLRNGELKLNAEMMDAFLRVLDEVNSMFDEIKSGNDPSPADPGLLQQLDDIESGEAGGAPAEEAAAEVETEAELEAEPEPAAEASEEAVAAEETASDVAAGGDDITDEEFEALLDALQGKGTAPEDPEPSPSVVAEESSEPAGGGDEITDDEFEALLDDLHGKGKGPGKETETTAAAGKEEAAESKPAATAASDSDEITDDEFDALLDDLHGKGKGPTATGDTAKPAAAKKESKPAPEPKKESKPAAANHR